MPRLLKFIPPAIFLLTLFFSVSAASSSSNAVRYGEGTSMISGWTISNIHYRYAGQADLLAAVEFDLDSPAEAVRVRLTGESGPFFPCYSVGGNHWICETGTGLPISAMKALQIVATSSGD